MGVDTGLDFYRKHGTLPSAAAENVADNQIKVE
jgi:hypothetical protein